MRVFRRSALALGAGLLLTGCGSEQATAPSPPGTNQPPVIHALLKNTDRAEVGGTIEFAVDVDDAETSREDLMYEWSATAGTILGKGSRVNWRAPVSAVPSMQEVALTVLDRYTIRAGRPIAVGENKATASAKVYVNNTPAELQSLAFTFIDDFIHTERTPTYCVRNFSDSCRGKTEELTDIANNRNRAGVKILDATSTIGSIAFNGAKTSADIVAPCTFRDQ